MEDTSTYNVNGKLYSIPSSEQEYFLKDMPEAKEVYVFENQGKKLGIPKDKVHDIMSHDYPELRPAPKENQSAVSKPVAQLISNQPTEAELNAKGEWNESTPKPEHINFTDHPLDATGQFARDIWGSAKQGGKDASNAIETGVQELGRYAAKLAGWMDSDNPKSVADSKKIEDHIQQNIGQLKADKAGIEQYTPMYKSAGYIGGAAPYMAAAMVSLATGSAEVGLASKAAFTLLGVGEGAQAYDKYTARNGKKTDEPTKALSELLYGALFTAPIAEELGKYMPTKWVRKLIGIDLLKNPEIEKTAGKVAFETFAKDQPTLAQRFLKPAVKGLPGSIAGMEKLMLGTEAVKRNLIGDTSGEESYWDIAKKAALTAICFHLAVSPFGVMRQEVDTKKRWDEAESIGITLDHKGKPVEVLPTEEGKEQKGRRPDGSIISVTPEMARNTFIIPGDVFRSEMQKVKSTGEASPGIERDAYSGRVTKMVNKLSDKNDNIHVATDGYGNNYYVTHQDENGDLHGVDTNGKQGIIDPELKIQTVNKGEVWRGLMNNYDQVKTPKEKQPEVQVLPIEPPAPTPSQQAETESRSFHKEHADKDTGNLKIVTQKTSEEGPDKQWFVTKEWTNPGTGKNEYIVQDGEGNHEALTQGQLAGDPKEISENEFADLSMNEFNLAQQTKQAQEDNTMIRDGQRLKRLPNGDGIGNKTEVFEDENGKYVEAPNEEVAAWEQAKQQTKDPNIVTRQYGKTKITGVKDGNNIAISDPMSLEEANILKEEVEHTTGRKSTVKTEPINNNDTTLPDSYKVGIVPMETPEEMKPATAVKKTPKQPEKPKYPVDKEGQPDIEQMDESQLFEYNKETFGEETAIADLKGDIQLVTDKIDKANKKLESSDTKTKIKTRLEIKDLNEQKSKLESLIPAKKENIIQKNTLKVPEIKNESAEVQQDNKIIKSESEQKLQENNLESLKTLQNATQEGKEQESDKSEHRGADGGQQGQIEAPAEETNNRNSVERGGENQLAELKKIADERAAEQDNGDDQANKPGNEENAVTGDQRDQGKEEVKEKPLLDVLKESKEKGLKDLFTNPEPPSEQKLTEELLKDATPEARKAALTAIAKDVLQIKPAKEVASKNGDKTGKSLTHIPKEELDQFDFKDEDITKAKKKCITRPKGGFVI